MKKITIVSLVSILFLSISSLVAYFLRFTNIDNWLLSFLIGILIMVFTLIVHAILRKNKNFKPFALLFNSIALGFLIRAWYIFRNFDNALWVMLLVSFVSAIYLWIFYLLLYIPFFEKHYGVFTIVFLIISFIGYILVMALTETTFISTFGYYMIIETAFILGLCMKSYTISELIRNLARCSYSILIVAIIILFIIVFQDGADFDLSLDFDVDGKGLSSPKDKKVRKDI